MERRECDECNVLIDTNQVRFRITDSGDKFALAFVVKRVFDDANNADLHQSCIESLLEGFVEAKLGGVAGTGAAAPVTNNETALLAALKDILSLSLSLHIPNKMFDSALDAITAAEASQGKS